MCVCVSAKPWLWGTLNSWEEKKKDLNSAALYHSLPSSSKKAPAARADDDMDMGGKGNIFFYGKKIVGGGNCVNGGKNEHKGSCGQK